MTLARDGFKLFGPDARVKLWAQAARAVAEPIITQEAVRAKNLRHGATWFVGVDILPNDAQGSISGVPLDGPWTLPELTMHRAQVSIIYPGYPQQDPGQSDANHDFRVRRRAAHVDGLLPVGPQRQRYLREFHAYILGIPLNVSHAAPTVVWRGSHRIIGQALRDAIGAADPTQVDVTKAYHAARKVVFETCEMVPLTAHEEGASFLIHRHALHGTDVWDGAPQGHRMIAFLRPEFSSPQEWLRND